MGLHRTYDTEPPPGPFPPGPVPMPPPVRGKKKDTCECASWGYFEWKLTDSDMEYFRKIIAGFLGVPEETITNEQILQWFMPGSKVRMTTWDDSSGEPTDPKRNEGSRAQGVTTANPLGNKGKELVSADMPLREPPDKKSYGDATKGQAGVTTSEPEPEESGWQKTDENEIEVENVVQLSSEGGGEGEGEGGISSGVELEVEGENPKGNVLKKKIKKSYPEEGEEEDPVDLGDVARDIVMSAGFGEDNIYIDRNIEANISQMNINEMYVKEALDYVSKLSGANYTITGKGEFMMFMPNSYPHPVLATTHPAKFGDGHFNEMFATINPIKKGTLKYEVDSSEMVNSLQCYSNEKSAVYTETFPGGSNEYHLSYTPIWCTAVITVTEIQTPLDCLIYQDWGDRPWLVNQFPRIPGTPISDYTDYSPICGEGPVVNGQPYAAYLNPKEKMFKIFHRVAPGYGMPPPENAVVQISYQHWDQTYLTVNNSDSIAKYGKRERVLVIPDYHCMDETRRLANATIRDYAEPIKRIECEVFNDVYRVGDYVHFVAPNLGLDTRMCVYSVEREFDVSRVGSQQDPGQTVKIKAATKIPISLNRILTAMNNRVLALERKFNATEYLSPSGVSVPVEREEYFEDKTGMEDFMEHEFAIAGARVDIGRVDFPRTDVS